jgi:EAL domain-containing protein (putative c-di-GMP-specific phosphodiesterase class I)
MARLGRPVRLAVDDAGAGFASLRHILELDPAFVKLDLSLIRDIDHDPAKQALVAGMRHFARTTKRRLIAEGVETAAEAATLTELDIRLGQGYRFGHPGPLPHR